MNFSTEIAEELYNISPLLAGIEKKNIFSVPDGYFNVLSMNVFKSIHTTAGQNKSTEALTVPDGYFENLEATILDKIKSHYNDAADELRTLSPMLYSIQNENVFEAPTGYFRSLQNNILDKILIKPQAKVIGMKTDSIWKYAAAAVVSGVIGLSSLMFFNKPQSSRVSEANDSVSSSIHISSQFKNEQQINAGIALLTEDEIIKYLERTGNDADNEALTTAIDENELPAAKDYLLDEKTLETYLNQPYKNSQN